MYTMLTCSIFRRKKLRYCKSLQKQKEEHLKASHITFQPLKVSIHLVAQNSETQIANEDVIITFVAVFIILSSS
jgi:hypothetical protein